MCDSVIFRLGVDYCGFEEKGLLNYVSFGGRYRKVPGIPDYVLGYILYEGKEVLVQDLRVRFGLTLPCARRDEKKNIIIYVDDRTGEFHGFVVDELVEFSDCRTEQVTPWGAEVLLENEPYKPFVASLAKAEVDRITLTFWLLRHQDLYPTPPATVQAAA